jgi:hypothetical protein
VDDSACSSRHRERKRIALKCFTSHQSAIVDAADGWGLYEFTIDALNAFYAKVSSDGFIGVDDFNDFERYPPAVLDFSRVPQHHRSHGH